jgi:hypothetical protein
MVAVGASSEPSSGVVNVWSVDVPVWLDELVESTSKW